MINLLLKKKISIVSSKIQTTNINIQAVLNYENCQMIFTDTPGIIEKTKFYNKKLSREIFKNLEEIDINLFVFDSTKKLNISKIKKIREINQKFKKNLLVLNKIDLINNELLLKQINHLNSELYFCDTFPVSVKKKIGVDKLLQKISKDAPHRKWIFGNTKIVERNVDFLVSEITREKIFNLLNKELPYVIKIESSIKDLKTLVKVEQRILVEKDSKKG